MPPQTKNKISIIFFGTKTLAETVLQGLIDSPLFSIEGVITQPDQPAGRKKEMRVPLVKILAEKYGIPVFQPDSLKEYQLSSIMSEAKLGVLVEYGTIIPEHAINAFPLGILNVHPSLLPAYRGATPVQSAISNGDAETGVTIMKLDIGLDTGPILSQKKCAIDPDDTFESLNKKLARIGTALLLEVIPAYVLGELILQKQDDAEATYSKQLTRNDGNIDWSKTAREIYNQWRAFTPWPGIFTMWQGKRLKLLKIRAIHKNIPSGIAAIEDGSLFIGCGKDAVVVEELQLEGKKAMESGDFLKGYRGIHNVPLGE